MTVTSDPRGASHAPIILSGGGRGLQDSVSEPVSRARRRRAQRPTADCVFACVGDGRGNDLVTAHAAVLSRSLGVPLWIGRVLEVASAEERAVDPIAWILAQQECRTTLDALAERHGAEAETVLLTGMVADRLIGWATDNRAGFVAMGARDCPGGFGLGATAQRLLENSDASLLLVPVDAAGAQPFARRYRRILVPLDGSQRAEAVLPNVIRIAHAQAEDGDGRAEIVLAHVTPAVEVVGGADGEVAELTRQLNAINASRASAALEVLRAQLVNNGLDAQVIVETGPDVRQRLHELPGELDADLVVLSAHGSRGIETACGSVASYMASRATRPTLIVRGEARVRQAAARTH